jgi:hypothetical protein
MTKSVKALRKAGRPPGRAARKRIELPNGDALVPFYTTFSEDTGINPKSLQRMRGLFPTVMVAGVLYVKDAAGREALANPTKRGRRR